VAVETPQEAETKEAETKEGEEEEEKTLFPSITRAGVHAGLKKFKWE
jgi:hypothetical protein